MNDCRCELTAPAFRVVIADSPRRGEYGPLATPSGLEIVSWQYYQQQTDVVIMEIAAILIVLL